MVFIQSRALPVIEQVSIQSKVDRQVAWINACMLPVDDAWRDHLWRWKMSCEGCAERACFERHARAIARLRILMLMQKLRWYKSCYCSQETDCLCVRVCVHMYM